MTATAVGTLGPCTGDYYSLSCAMHVRGVGVDLRGHRLWTLDAQMVNQSSHAPCEGAGTSGTFTLKVPGTNDSISGTAHSFATGPWTTEVQGGTGRFAGATDGGGYSGTFQGVASLAAAQPVLDILDILGLLPVCTADTVGHGTYFSHVFAGSIELTLNLP